MAHHQYFKFQPCLILSFFLLLATALQHGAQAVEYVVTNRAESTRGGALFNSQLGADYTKQTMAEATAFIWNVFRQTTEADRKSVATVSFFVDDMGPQDIAYATSNNEIHVGDDYIERITTTNTNTGDTKNDFNGVLYHEMTHIWQWNANGQRSDRIGNLTEGIADFVRLKANYVPSGWAAPGQGDRWDQGYSVTARFLDYCNDVKDGFVAELNKKMRDGYSDEFFVQITGKTADQLWSEYKARYGS